jgi:hypothetical protein
MKITPTGVHDNKDIGYEAYNGISKTLEEFQMRETYSNSTTNGGLNWSFGDNDTNPWKIEESKNNGLPYLYWQDL